MLRSTFYLFFLLYFLFSCQSVLARENIRKIFSSELQKIGYSRGTIKKHLELFFPTVRELYKKSPQKYRELLYTYQMFSNERRLKRIISKYPELFGVLAIAAYSSKRFVRDVITITKEYNEYLDKILLFYSITLPGEYSYKEGIKLTNNILLEFKDYLQPLLELNFIKFFHLFLLSEGFISEKNKNTYIRWLLSIQKDIVNSPTFFRKEFFYNFAQKNSIVLIKNLTKKSDFSDRFRYIWGYYRQYLLDSLEEIEQTSESKKRELKKFILLHTSFLWEFFYYYGAEKGYNILKKNSFIAALVLFYPEVRYSRRIRDKLINLFRRENKRSAIIIFSIFRRGERERQLLLDILYKLEQKNINPFLADLWREKNLRLLEKYSNYSSSELNALYNYKRHLKFRSPVSKVIYFFVPEYLVKLYRGVPLELGDYISIIIDLYTIYSFIKHIDFSNLYKTVTKIFGWEKKVKEVKVSLFSKVINFFIGDELRLINSLVREGPNKSNLAKVFIEFFPYLVGGGTPKLILKLGRKFLLTGRKFFKKLVYNTAKNTTRKVLKKVIKNFVKKANKEIMNKLSKILLAKASKKIVPYLARNIGKMIQKYLHIVRNYRVARNYREKYSLENFSKKFSKKVAKKLAKKFALKNVERRIVEEVLEETIKISFRITFKKTIRHILKNILISNSKSSASISRGNTPIIVKKIPLLLVNKTIPKRKIGMIIEFLYNSSLFEKLSVSNGQSGDKEILFVLSYDYSNVLYKIILSYSKNNIILFDYKNKVLLFALKGKRYIYPIDKVKLEGNMDGPFRFELSSAVRIELDKKFFANYLLLLAVAM